MAATTRLPLPRASAAITSLDVEYYLAAERDLQIALFNGDRLVRAMKSFHADAPEAKALEGRLTEMEAVVETYERNLVDLGDYEF